MTDAMLRYNTGKSPLSLVPSSFYRALADSEIWGASLDNFDTHLLEDVGHVLGFGAKKYSANNWRKSGSWLEVADCAFRHMVKIVRGETHDIESGIHHAAHAACNFAFLLEFVAQNSGDDDRYHVEWFPLINFDNGSDFDHAFELFLNWKDGGPVEQLIQASQYLACWYENLPEDLRAFQPGTSPFAPIQATVN